MFLYQNADILTISNTFCVIIKKLSNGDTKNMPLDGVSLLNRSS